MPAEFTELLNTSLGSMSMGNVISAIIALIVCFVITKMLLKIVNRIISKSKLEARIQKYVLMSAKLVLYVITALIVIDSIGIPITSLVALLSVVSLGITLAAEDILANIAGGLVILSARPFDIGDFVEASGVSGTVMEITLNYTKLETPDGLLVMLPNKTLADSQMINYTALGRRRITQKVTASYDAPTDSVKAACHEAITLTENVLADPEPSVYLSKYGESSIEYTVFCWANASDYWPVHFGLAENLRTTFARNGVEMTYDHLNVHIVENRA